MDRLQQITVMLMVVLMIFCDAVSGQDNATESSVPSCPCVNGVCSRKVNDSAATCVCDLHWQGDNCDEEINRCDEESPCGDVNAVCTTNTGLADGFQCACKDGFYTGADGKCVEYQLWRGYLSGDSQRLETSSDPSTPSSVTLSSQYPVPFFQFNSVFVTITDRGYIRLGGASGHSDIEPYVKSSWSAWPFYMAPYWTNFRFDSASNESGVFYSQVDLHEATDADRSLLDYARTIIRTEPASAQFTPLAAYVVTWAEGTPDQCSHAGCDEQRSTVQLVLATDFQYSYAIVTWHSVFSGTDLAGGPEVYSGHSSPDGGFVQLQPDPAPRRVVKPLFSSGQPTSDPAQCGQSINSRDWSALVPCPCQKKDVDLDFRFTAIPSESTGDLKVYRAKFFTGGLKQTCHYDSLGIYISDPAWAAVPVEETPSNPTVQAVKTSCCAISPVFCSYFYRDVASCTAAPVLKVASGGGLESLYMTTFSRDQFTFNGWGEFVVLQTGDMELQARTERNGDQNTTYFSAYALRPSSASGSAVYQIYVNTEGSLEGSWTEGAQAGADLFDAKLEQEKTLTITVPGMMLKVNRLPDPSQTNVLSHSLAHTITLPAGADTRGLSGNHGDTSQLPAPHVTEEWRVANQTVSLFDYKKPSDSTFEDVNNHDDFQPELLPMEASQVLDLFTDETVKNQSVDVCGQAVFCLQASYLSGGNNDVASSALARSQMVTEIAGNLERRPPEFQPMNAQELSPSTIAGNVTLEFALVSSPAEDEVTYSLRGSFSEVEGVSTTGSTLDLMGVSLAALRSLTYPQSLGIVATNVNTSLSYVYWPRLYLCLCEMDGQCLNFDFDHVDQNGQMGISGNVIQVGCRCGSPSSAWPNATGRHCESEFDVCTNCHNASACDASRSQDYCAPCPAEHTQGNGFKCRDIDECHTDNGGCQQVCSNTDFGAECSCNPGYNANGSRCHDINECVQDLSTCPSPTKYCFNLPGSHDCRCYGNGFGDNCVMAPYTYAVSLTLAPVFGQRWGDISGDTNTQAKEQLKTKLHTAMTARLTQGSTSVVSGTEQLFVEITGFSRLNQRSRRSTEREPEVSATSVVRSTSALSDTSLTTALGVGDCETNCDFSGLLVYGAPELQPEEDLCSIPLVNTCDEQTSTCTNIADNRVLCQCLPGFEPAQNPNFCHDKDECATGTHNCLQQDNCTNTFGSYLCGCDTGHYWDKTALQCTADACQSNPCDDRWQCDLVDGGAGHVCSPLAGALDNNEDDWRTATIVVSCVLGVLCLCLIIAVIVLARRRKKTLDVDAYSSSRYNDLAGQPRQQGYNKRGSSTEMSEQRNRRNVYEAPGRNGDYSQVYDNRAYSNDRL